MKKLIAITSATLAYLSLARFAFAQAPAPLIGCPGAPFNVLCFDTTSVPGIIAAAITFIFVIAVIIALFFLLFGALKWIFSGGDKAGIESARGTIVAAIVGLIIIFLVFLIFTVVLRFFGLSIINITNIPSIGGAACLPAGASCPFPGPPIPVCCGGACVGPGPLGVCP